MSDKNLTKLVIVEQFIKEYNFDQIQENIHVAYEYLNDN